MRPWSILALVLTLAAAASVVRADVVILEGNDVPLTGEIVSETETELRFRIKGLTEDSHIVILKSRVRRYWREENTYWEHKAGEDRRREAVERLGLSDRKRKAKASVAPTPAPAPVRVAPRSRTGAEIRKDIIDRALDRLAFLVPSDPGLRILAWLAGFGALSLLLYLGGRVADLEHMRLGRAAILGLVTQFLILLGVLAYRSVVEPMTAPLLFSGLIVAWILTSRMLAGDRVSKSVLLLSFSVATLLLLAGSLFSVLSFV